MTNKHNISRDEIAEAMQNDFGFNRKLCLDIVNDIIDIVISGLERDKKVKIHNFGTFTLNRKNSRGKSPRKSTESLRGTLRPSTYFHVPQKKNKRKSKKLKKGEFLRKKKNRNEREVIETMIIGTYENENGITIASSPDYKSNNNKTCYSK